jgi:hypothetical protein
LESKIKCHDSDKSNKEGKKPAVGVPAQAGTQGMLHLKCAAQPHLVATEIPETTRVS